ncbi:MAG: hypothetical protein SGI91_08660 [Alphaproteobacteria bacterium]|nr:hypothetical protein [Alphaproteobacteria bacterium]
MDTVDPNVEDIPLEMRFVLFWTTFAALIGLAYTLANDGLLPAPGTPQDDYFAKFSIGWSILVFGIASILWINRSIRRALEDTFVDAKAGSAEEAAERRLHRFYRRVAQNNRHWVWARARLRRMTGAEFLIMERRRRIQFWITTVGFWLLLVGMHRPEVAGNEGIVVWTGLALALGFPFLKGMEGLGKRNAA